MIKNILLTAFLAVFFASSFVFAQSLELVRGDETVKGALDDELVSYGRVKNISDEEVTITIKIEIIEITQGHELQPCFNMNCYPMLSETTVYSEPSQQFSLAPGEVTDDQNFKELFTHLYPNGNSGVTKVKFYFMISDDDYAAYECTYTAGVSSVNDEFLLSSGITYPNPANDFLNINVKNISNDYQLNVYDSQGLNIRGINYEINSGNILLNTAALNQGMYFYTLIADGAKKMNGKFSIVR